MNVILRQSKCARCGAIFEPVRRTARFCSDRCRVAASRNLSVTRPVQSPQKLAYQGLALDGGVFTGLQGSLEGRAWGPDDYLLLPRILDAPTADDGDDLTAARGFYSQGAAARRAGKSCPFPLMTAADLWDKILYCTFAYSCRVAWHYISPRTSRSIPRQAVRRQAHWRSGGHNAPEAPLARSITFASIAPFASIVDPSTVTGAPTLRWAPMR
jgi:hypothetical protein